MINIKIKKIKIMHFKFYNIRKEMHRFLNLKDKKKKTLKESCKSF